MEYLQKYVNLASMQCQEDSVHLGSYKISQCPPIINTQELHKAVNNT